MLLLNMKLVERRKKGNVMENDSENSKNVSKKMCEKRRNCTKVS